MKILFLILFITPVRHAISNALIENWNFLSQQKNVKCEHNEDSWKNPIDNWNQMKTFEKLHRVQIRNCNEREQPTPFSIKGGKIKDSMINGTLEFRTGLK